MGEIPVNSGVNIITDKSINRLARKDFRLIKAMLGEPVPLFIPVRVALRKESSYPYSFRERATLLPSNSQEGFGGVIRRERNAGLKEIHAQIGSMDTEHSWIFIPILSLWIDETIGATNEDFFAKPVVDGFLPTFLSRMVPEIELVHTHPDKISKELYQSVREIVGEEDSQEYRPHLQWAAQPSSVDFRGHFDLYGLNSEASYTTSIVSHYGVTSLSLNERGRNAKGLGNNKNNTAKFLIDENNDPVDEINKMLEYTRQQAAVEITENGTYGQPLFDFTFTSL